MEHKMRLTDAPFQMMKSGKKTIELRLYDEKRKAISVGDVIVFVHAEDESKILKRRVAALHLFASFAELYEALPLLLCGYTEETVHAASHVDMDVYYSKEEQKACGVVGIELSVC